MLNLQEFQEYVQINLPDILPEEYKDMEVALEQVTKNNGRELHAITIRSSESNIAPTIYLDKYFQNYQDGADVDLLIEDIAKVAMENINPPTEFSNIAHDFRNFDYVKDKIIMVAVNTEKNHAMLAEVPHQNREDLSLIYKVMLGTDKEGIATITIKNQHMEFWRITVDELHDLAMKNTKEILPVTIQSMNEVMREMFANDGMTEEIVEAMFEELPINEQMYVISNTSRVNGAAAMFYEDALSGLADQMGTDLYILPSSVHECIAVSTDMGIPESFAEMVREVNGLQVSAEEQLSDHVYRFDAKAKTISIADTTMDQLQTKASKTTAIYDESETNTEGSRPRHHR